MKNILMVGLALFSFSGFAADNCCSVAGQKGCPDYTAGTQGCKLCEDCINVQNGTVQVIGGSFSCIVKNLSGPQTVFKKRLPRQKTCR